MSVLVGYITEKDWADYNAGSMTVTVHKDIDQAFEQGGGALIPVVIRDEPHDLGLKIIKEVED